MTAYRDVPLFDHPAPDTPAEEPPAPMPPRHHRADGHACTWLEPGPNGVQCCDCGQVAP